MARRQVLVDAAPGLTRDRLYGEIQWRGVPFQVVDTGGLEIGAREPLARKMMLQVEKAVQEADLCLFLCDAREGIMPLDRKVADWIRPFGKKILLVVNKVDTETQAPAIHEFSALGLGEPVGIASLHGLGVGDLLDQVVERLSASSFPRKRESDPRFREDDTQGEAALIRVALVGRPNVGKSSLVNRLLNEERVLVDETPGTTRDPVDTYLTFQGRRFCLVDTAGIRARRKLQTKIDKVARLKTSQTIERSDVCVGVLDATQGIVNDDLKLLDEVVTLGRALVLAVNKWDLAKKGLTEEETAETFHRRAPFLRFAPVVAVSAKTGYQVPQLLDRAAWAASQANRKLTAAEKERLIEVLQNDRKAPVGVRNMGLVWAAQVGSAPPVFHFVGRMARPLSDSDRAYLERVVRGLLKWEGTPIRIRTLRRKR